MKKPNKIRITGGSGSGKTYLGKKIAEQTKIELTSMDKVAYDFSKTTKFDHKKPEQEIKKEIQKILKRKKWIIEGGYYKLTKKSYDEAEIIIYLKPSLKKRITNTTKRYIKRLIERKNEGLLNFTKLTVYNIKTRNKWQKQRQELFKEKYKNKIKFFKTADEAQDWFVKQKK
jgi:adenylate kinase family enzyme